MGSKKIVGIDNVRKEMQRVVCSFASYIKHKERGKKDRRAIASATMLLRPFLHITESFHLGLSKGLMGFTNSIGGEEKKAKITSNMEVTALDTEWLIMCRKVQMTPLKGMSVFRQEYSS